MISNTSCYSALKIVNNHDTPYNYSTAITADNGNILYNLYPSRQYTVPFS